MPNRISKYLDIAKKGNTVDYTVPNNEQPSENEIPVKSIRHPRRYGRSYGSWEYSYFSYLIRLRNIFAEGMMKLFPDMEEYLYSIQFMKIFSKFIYRYSSTDIPVWLEPFPQVLEREYYLYSTSTTL